MFTPRQLHHLSTISSYLKTQLKLLFFFLPSGFFPTSMFSLYLLISVFMQQIRRVQKNSLSYLCSTTWRCSHPEFFVSSKKILIKSYKIILDVRYQAALKQRGGRGAMIS